MLNGSLFGSRVPYNVCRNLEWQRRAQSDGRLPGQGSAGIRFAKAPRTLDASGSSGKPFDGCCGWLPNSTLPPWSTAGSTLAVPAFNALEIACTARGVSLPTMWPSHSRGKCLPQGCFIIMVRQSQGLGSGVSKGEEEGVNPSGYQINIVDAPLSGACHVLWGLRGPPGGVLRVAPCSSTLKVPPRVSFTLGATNSAR